MPMTETKLKNGKTNTEQIIRELELCYEFFINMPYRREMIRQAIDIIKEG